MVYRYPSPSWSRRKPVGDDLLPYSYRTGCSLGVDERLGAATSANSPEPGSARAISLGLRSAAACRLSDEFCRYVLSLSATIFCSAEVGESRMAVSLQPQESLATACFNFYGLLLA